jgi:hypothetical protein
MSTETIVSEAMTERRAPLHLTIFLGSSAALYAVSLAGITGLQSGADRAMMDRSAPSEQAAERLRLGHDRLQSGLERSTRDLESVTARYDAVVNDLSSFEETLATHTAEMATLTRDVRALPKRAALPSVTRVVTTTIAKPRVRGSTGASGG